MSDDLLQQADQLMRRHRVFVAEGAAPAPSRPAEDDDVPILTDVVSVDAAAAPSERFRAALAEELEAWLDREVPGHVLHVLDGLADQLIMQLGMRARTELLPRLLTALNTVPLRQEDDVTGS